MNGLLARIETASFFEEERRKKDIVESRWRLVRSDPDSYRDFLLLKKSVPKKLETDLYIWFCFAIAFPGIKVGKQWHQLVMTVTVMAV